MTADSRDNLPYRSALEMSDEAARRHYWVCAIGLQEVDGLTVSERLRDLANDYIGGCKSINETGELIRAYHSPESHDYDRDADDCREADLVSQRIAELLAGGSFALIPDMPRIVHKRLFQDLTYDTYKPGEYRLEPLTEQEEIPNGDSVLYADPTLVSQSLRYLFSEEKEAGDYGTTLAGDDLARFARFIALIWQVHPFRKGNTRTTAVLAELYLKQLGFKTGNEPFEHHARYFRDALVRANYRNAAAGIAPEPSFLELFLDNLINGAAHPLIREEMLCPALFDDPDLLRNVSPGLALHRN